MITSSPSAPPLRLSARLNLRVPLRQSQLCTGEESRLKDALSSPWAEVNDRRWPAKLENPREICSMLAPGTVRQELAWSESQPTSQRQKLLFFLCSCGVRAWRGHGSRLAMFLAGVPAALEGCPGTLAPVWGKSSPPAGTSLNKLGSPWTKTSSLSTPRPGRGRRIPPPDARARHCFF